MIVHYKKFDGNLGAGEFVTNIPTNRTAIKVFFNCHIQVDDDRIVARLGRACWRCLGLKKNYAPNAGVYYDCTVCKRYSMNIGERVRCIATGTGHEGLLGVVVQVGQRGHEYAPHLLGTEDDHGPWCEVKFDDSFANRDGNPIYVNENLQYEER